MSKLVSSKGTTGLSVVYDGENDCIRVLAKDSTVLVYTVYEYPESLLSDDKDNDMFEWVMENHSSDISECLEALGL